MSIDPSSFSSVLSIPSNQLLNNPFSGSAFSSIHGALGGLPTSADFSNATIDPSVSPATISALSGHLSSLNTISAGGSLASMDGITSQMTNQIVPTPGMVNTVPPSLFSAPGMPALTSSMSQNIGVPNAMSLLSTAQSSQSMANQMLGHPPGSPQQCSILADINGVIKTATSALGALYGDISAGINALEHTIAATVSQFAAAVRAALPTVTIDPITGLQVTVPGVPIASGVLTSIASAISTAYSSITSAMSAVVGAIDAAAVAIENQMKLGIAGLMANLNADPCFGALAKTMTGPSLSAVLKV